MSLAAGTRIGVYEIRDSLGAGEMGEVSRAGYYISALVRELVEGRRWRTAATNSLRL
jgi:hypothetical protein